MQRVWRIANHDAALIADLERSAGVPAIVAQLLVARGVTAADDARRFLDAKLTGLYEPERLPGVSAAADRIHAAIERQTPICVYGDYDCDGMTAIAILVRCLRMLGGKVRTYVPNRMEEGYGLNCEALTQIHGRGDRLVVTVDCGVASLLEAEHARQIGLELIVTDHHQMTEALPQADVVVHPALPGGGYPFPSLCGAGVALKLAWAICQRASGATKVSPRMRSFLLQAVGLSAIGTVADVVPLLDENRILVRHGLVSLRANPPTGLARLMAITGLAKKPELSAEDIAFTIGPRLNAAGRLGQAALAVELLLTEDEDRARSLAEYIHQLNESRGSLERSVYRAAHKQLKESFDPERDPAFVLADHGWHGGIIGIVAGRLAEKYHRPVVVISLDEAGVRPGAGSVRSVAGVDVHRALAVCEETLLGFGGHRAAAGLTIDPQHIDAFRNSFCEAVAAERGADAAPPEIAADAQTPLGQLTLGVVKQIESLGPFGSGNPRPLLIASGVSLAGEPKRIGGGERHLSVRLRQSQRVFKAVGFGLAERIEELNGGPLDIAFHPMLNHFAGRVSVELQLIDWRPAEG